MTDIKNVHLLWLKGGLFLLLGGMAAGLLILQARNLTEVGLLALAIWAFCRAYYFAFYVIEKYVDPSFRFAGLTSFARYMIVGHVVDAPVNSSEEMLESASDPTDGSRLRIVYWISLRWFLLALITNLLAPTLSNELDIRKYGRWLQDLLIGVWIGWLAVQVAVTVIAAALLRVPLKHRLPIGLTLILVLAFTLVLAVRLQVGWWNADNGLLLIATLVTFTLGFICLLVYRWYRGWVLAFSVAQDDLSAGPSVRNKEQFSIGYLMALTAAVAAFIALLKMFSIDFSFVFQPRFLFTVLAGFAIEICVVSLSIIMVHATLSCDSHRCWVNVVVVVLSIIVVPYLIMVGISQLSAPFPKPSAMDYCGMYVFFLSYSMLFHCVLLSYRETGLRMIRSARSTADSLFSD